LPTVLISIQKTTSNGSRHLKMKLQHHLQQFFVVMHSFPVNELVNKALLNISDEKPCNDIFQFQFSIQLAA
jgi:hypothetical protein